MHTDIRLEAAALRLIEEPVEQNPYAYEVPPGNTENGDRTLLFPQNETIRIVGDCHVMRVEDWLESTDLTYGPCILLIEHADRRHFAGRFENLAAALPAISRLSYRSQLDEKIPF